jgi:hypothetical protein
MSGPGYLHPFLPGVIYANGAGEEIRTVRSPRVLRLSLRSHFAPFHITLQLAELKMNYFSYWIRSQADWWLNHQDEGTTAGWRATARREDYLQDALALLGYKNSIEDPMDPRGPRYALHVLMAAPHLMEAQIDWVLDELSDIAARRVSQDHIQVSSLCMVILFIAPDCPLSLAILFRTDMGRFSAANRACFQHLDRPRTSLQRRIPYLGRY